MGWEGVDWINVAEYRHIWKVVVSAAMRRWVPQNELNCQRFSWGLCPVAYM